MKPRAVSPEVLKTLPRTIWMAQQGSVSVYSGTPVEMCRQMASEMGEPSVRDAINTLLTKLSLNRHVLIGIPEDVPEEILSALFVHALLQSGVSRPLSEMAQS